MPINVAIVEDDTDIRQSLEDMLANDGDINCVASFPNAEEFLGSFKKQQKTATEYDTLTEREKAILQHLSKGYQYKEIAAKLFLSVETIRTYIRHIYEKLQVHSRTEALNKVFIK